MKTSKERLCFRERVRLILKALKVSIRTKSKVSIFISVAGFLMAFAPVLIANVLRRFTDEIQAMATANTKSLSDVLTTFIVLACLFIIQAVFNSLQSYVQGVDGIRTDKYIRETVLRCTCDVKYKYVENYDDFKEKILFADTYGGLKVAGSMQMIIIWFQNFITFVSIFCVLVNVNMWIVIILLATCIPSVILSYKQKDESYRNNVKWMKEGAMVIHYFHICAGEHAMSEVRHLGIFNYLKCRWRENSEMYVKIKNDMTKKHVLYNSYADVLRNAVYIGVLLIVTKEIYQKPEMGLGVFMLVFTLSRQLQDVTSRLLIEAAKFESDIFYMKDFFNLENFERDNIDDTAESIENASIKFENVNFTYPNSTNKVLKNLNVTIKNGEKIAVVGENGSGKSTFVSLICGMYEPDSGVIKVNDINIQDNLTAVRRSISVVFQDFGHYETTIRENITISDKHRNASDKELFDLVHQTNAYEVVVKQPEKFDEEIGIFSKNGNDLSGGQWQKIAITRAAYRNKAKIMILDEPTAALDPIAEAQLYSDFANLTEGKTTILISHRLGIISVVDRVLVFKDGEIIEDGSHKELIKNNGYYAKMYYAQAQWYDDTVNVCEAK